MIYFINGTSQDEFWPSKSVNYYRDNNNILIITPWAAEMTELNILEYQTDGTEITI